MREPTDPQDPGVYNQSFYVHDRLGSVRLVVRPFYDEQMQEWAVRAMNSYMYTPFGQFYEGQWQCFETVYNPWKFTGQWYDEEIGQYYLRARQYDPTMMRFTSRDPVMGSRQEPLTLHKYLYCLNDPLNRTDTNGKMPQAAATLNAQVAVYITTVALLTYTLQNNNFQMFDAALDLGSQLMSLLSFRNHGKYDGNYDYKQDKELFELMNKCTNGSEPPDEGFWKKLIWYVGQTFNNFFGPGAS